MLWRLRNKPETRTFFTVSITHCGLQDARNPDWKALSHLGRFSSQLFLDARVILSNHLFSIISDQWVDIIQNGILIWLLR
jgi:hypothetical protein